MEARAVNDLTHDEVLVQLQGTPHTLRADEVLIRLCGVSISMLDIPEPPNNKADKVLIRECSGHVVKVGSSVTRFEIGDKVCAVVSMRGYAEEVVVSSEYVFEAPPKYPLVHAAAVPSATCVSYFAIIKCLNLRAGYTIVIHDTLCCLTYFALIRATWDGLKVIVVTDGGDGVMEWYKKAGAIACIDCMKFDFVEKIRTLTGMKGADALLLSHEPLFDIIGEYYSGCLSKNAVILLAHKVDQHQLASSFAQYKVYDIESLMASMDKKTMGSLVREARSLPMRCSYVRYLTIPPSEISTLEVMKLHGHRKVIIENKEEVGMQEDEEIGDGEVVEEEEEEEAALSPNSIIAWLKGSVFKSGHLFKTVSKSPYRKFKNT